MMKNEKVFQVLGPVGPQEVEQIGLTLWNVLDLSQATFSVNRIESTDAIVSHGRVMVTRPKVIDPLLSLLSSVHAVKVVLPANVSRKQLNAAIKNDCIYQIVVTDDCALFSMKDGDVWNKKGTILLYKQQEPKYIPCEECGRLTVSTDVIVSAEGKILCRECLGKYNYCEWCYRYFSIDNSEGPKEKGGPCKECMERHSLES